MNFLYIRYLTKMYPECSFSVQNNTIVMGDILFVPVTTESIVNAEFFDNLAVEKVRLLLLTDDSTIMEYSVRDLALLN